MLKILHIASSKSGGAGRAAYRIHTSLLNSNVESKFIALDKPDNVEVKTSKRSNLTHKIEWRLSKHLNLEFGRRKFFGESSRITPLLNCEIASIPVSELRISNKNLIQSSDIIHLHWVAENFDYKSFFEEIRKPIVWTLHDMNPFMGLFHYKADSERNKKVAGKLEEYIIQYKKKIIYHFKFPINVVTPSSWLKEEAHKSEIFRDREIDLIPNPINTSDFTSKDKTAIRMKIGLPQHRRILIAVTDSIENYRKGLDMLLEAVSSMHEILLLMIGKKASDHNTQDNVQFLGRLNNDNQLSEYYLAADATVIPSREDNLPNVMLESLSCGTPVISFKVGGMVDHVHNFKTGILAEEMTSESLASAIQLFFENETKFDGGTIQQYAKEQFDEKLIAAKYIEIYNRCLNSKSGI